MGSRDLRRIYAIDAQEWTVLEEKEAPGIPWAAVAVNDSLRFTIGAKVRTMTVTFADSILRVGFQRRTESLVRSLPGHISATTASIST
jgi:hypothetical protein